MPETHQAEGVLRVLGLGDEFLHIAAVGGDLLQHFQHFLVGAAMQRTPQGKDAGRYRREQVGARRADQTHGGRRAVLFVVGVQDQQDFQRLHQVVVDHVGLTRHAEHHAQEIGAIAQAVVGIQ